MKNSNFTQEEMLLDAYKRMQQSILKLAEYMAAHIDYIGKGQGHMAYGDIDYVLNTIMSDINWNIRKISTQKVNITRGEMKQIGNSIPVQVPPAQSKPISPWTSTSTDGKNYQFEAKKCIKKITESQLKAIVAESVKEVLSEIGDTPRAQLQEGIFDKKYRDGASIREYIQWKHRNEGLFVSNNGYNSRDSRGAIELSDGQNTVKLLLPATEKDIEIAINRLSGKGVYRNEYDSQRGAGFDSRGRF